jgi:tetratricopeptide (TPR) repeat protein
MAHARLQLMQAEKRGKTPLAAGEVEAYFRGEGSLADLLRLGGDELERLRARGVALLEAGHHEEARAFFECLEVIEGPSPAFDFAQAWALDQLGDTEAARARFQRGQRRLREAGLGTDSTTLATLAWGANRFGGEAE